MFLVGLTGGIATGKSTVSAMFSELNVPVIDSDQIARKVVEPGRKAWNEIRNSFGPGVFESESGQLNRTLLGNIIFNDPERRAELNRITHPEVTKEICWSVLGYLFRGYQFVVIDSPLLFEANTSVTKYMHKIIVVTCEEDLQLQRLMDRNGLKESDAKARVLSQMSLREKCARAHYVIENSGNLADTREQVMRIYQELRESRAHWKIRFWIGVLGLCSGGILSFLFWFVRRWLSGISSSSGRKITYIP